MTTFTNGFYQFVQDVPYTTFYKDEFIEYRDNNFIYNKAIIPNMLKKFLLENPMILKRINTLPIGSTVSGCGTIVEIVPNNANKTLYYIVKYDDKKSTIRYDTLKLAKEYYFISSTGKIQKDFLGRDIELENFRKKANNFFSEKNHAAIKLYSILGNNTESFEPKIPTIYKFRKTNDDFYLVYKVLIFKDKVLIKNVVIIGSEKEDIFTEAVKECKPYCGNLSMEEIEEFAQNTTFFFNEYDFLITCECDCVQYLNI